MVVGLPRRCFSFVALYATAYEAGGTPDPAQIDSNTDGIPDTYDNCPNDPNNECFCEDRAEGGALAAGTVLMYYALVGVVSPVHLGVALVGGAVHLAIDYYCFFY